MPTVPPWVQSSLSRIRDAFGPPANDLGRVLLAAEKRNAHRDVYAVLMAYYENNALYDSLQRQLVQQGAWHEAMKALRNPTYRVVEFYASKLWGSYIDELDLLEPDGDVKLTGPLADCIRLTWKWSNWSTNKILASRKLARDGDWFAKAAQNGKTGDKGRVYFQELEASTVTDFAEERGNIVWLRMDVPLDNGPIPATTQPRYWTEVWSKADGAVTIYQHSKTPETPLTELTQTARTTFEELGIDFVPIVHARFKHVGKPRGAAAIMPALDKIDEANRQATRLHQMAFRNSRVNWALAANQVTSEGRPISAPRVRPDDPAAAVDQGEQGTLQLGEERFFRLPGNTSMEPMVPDLPYEEMLAILNAQMDEVGRDLPELAYYSIREMSTVTGVAVRLMLSDTIDRAMEVRGNHFDAVQRLNMMCCTLGKAAGIPQFQALGDFDAGELDHIIRAPDIIQESKQEKAARRQIEGQAASALQDAGVSKATTLEEMGYDAEQEATQKESEQEVNDANLLTAFERGAPALGSGAGGGGLRRIG